MESTRVIVLRQARQRLRARAAAQPAGVPDPLVAATVELAVQVAEGQPASRRLVSAGAMHMVRDALRALAENRWRLGSGAGSIATAPEN
jgi:hypothetical protein